MSFIEDARAMQEELTEIRRYLHTHPEIGFDLTNTVLFVQEKLIEYGYQPEVVPNNGVVATIGDPNHKTILLRADMDALPIKEETGLDYASINEYMHACGHDIHTTMLLGAAKLLKENESKLKGQVKLLFQPAEELLIGGQVMVDEGVLENPTVDAALGMHVWPKGKPGIAVRTGPFMASANNFKITIQGKGTHGAQPYLGVDPIYIGAKIITGVPELLAREVPFDQSANITMGRFIGDGAVNVIPDTATIEGTLRTFTPETQEYIKQRLPEMIQKIAETYRGSAEIEFLNDVPALHNDVEFSEKVIGYLEELAGSDIDIYETPMSHGSEDFAFIAKEVPAFFYLLHMPDPKVETQQDLHHPSVTFDEEMMPIGSASIAYAAKRWLEEN